MKWQFWKWLFLGLEDGPGYHRVVNWWLLLHIATGIIITCASEVPIHEAAQAFLLPLAGILIGLTFAWTGNIQALLKEKEIQKLAEHHPDGIQVYMYIFQLAMLVILVTVVAWGLAGLRIFDAINCHNFHVFIEFSLYFLASLTLQQCWRVVQGSQMLIYVRYQVQKATENEKDD